MGQGGKNGARLLPRLKAPGKEQEGQKVADACGVRLTVLGARGSVPVSGPATAEFGGATSCFMLEAQGKRLFLDAGTGLLNAPVSGGEAVTLLLTHPHADHLLGLPMFLTRLRPGQEVSIYGRALGGLSVRQQVERLISPPLWPCDLARYPLRVRCMELSAPLRLGPFSVEAMEGAHPGGALVFRVSAGGKVLVCATDFEHDALKAAELARFAAGADLLLYDGQYTPAQYEARRGYGHSTAEEGLRIMRESGVKALRVVHHDPFAADVRLRERERALQVPFARQGEVVVL